jgi:hypothetical protein
MRNNNSTWLDWLVVWWVLCFEFVIIFVVVAIVFPSKNDDQGRGPDDGYLTVATEHVVNRTGDIEVIVNAEGFKNVVTFCNDGHRVFVQEGTGITAVEDGCDEIGER